MYTRATNFIWAILDRLQLFVLVVIASNSSTIGSFVPPLPKCAGPNVGNQWTKPIQIPFDSSDLTSLYSYFTCQSKLTDILAKFMSLWCSWIKHAIPLLKGSAIKPGLYSVHFCPFYHFLRLSVVYTANVKSLLWHLCLCFHCTSHHILVSLLCSSCIRNYLPWCRSKNNMRVGFPPNVPNYEKNLFTYLGTQFHFNSWAKHCFSLLE